MKGHIAIKGHPTRGEEVIKLLEMLGGNNFYNLSGFDGYSYYVIEGCLNEIRVGIFCDEDMYLFTLEEFLEKYPFKVGDEVFLYDNITDGCVTGMEWDKDKGTVKYCVYTSAEYWCDVKELLKWNKALTNKETYDIKSGNSKCERTHEDVIFDSIIWHLRNSVNNGKQNLSGGECEDYFREVVKKNNENKMKNVLAELLDHIKNTSKEELEKEFNELEEWSNVGPTVEEFRTFCECVNKKPAYPKTYVECCEVIANSKPYAMNEHYTDINKLLQTLQTIFICRNAYWKIAGEQMGLGKPWEPDWDNLSTNHEFIKINKGCFTYSSRILVFPTEEMRDAFYENFKDLIESCKELL